KNQKIKQKQLIKAGDKHERDAI
ncbi:MAG: hypothetical protein RLY99_163, partial [Pseudomonadota bacterium]